MLETRDSKVRQRIVHSNTVHRNTMTLRASVPLLLLGMTAPVAVVGLNCQAVCATVVKTGMARQTKLDGCKKHGTVRGTSVRSHCACARAGVRAATQ